MNTTTSKQTANERLRAFSSEREALRRIQSSEKHLKRSDPLEPGDPGTPEYQKRIRDNRDERLKSLGITRAHPFIASNLVVHVSVLASSVKQTRPITMGAIVSAFLAKSQKDQLAILDALREDAIKSASVVLPKLKSQDISNYSRHNERQKLQGNLRKMMYLLESDLEKLNTLRDVAGYESQGNLVNAILEDFFEKKQPHSQPFIINDHCLEI
jgi:hypothetical protein